MVKMRKSHLNLGNGSCFRWAFAFAVLVTGVWGQESLESNFRMSGGAITEVFEPQREIIQKCSAVFYEGRNEIVYGVVVSEDGYIMTKASEIEGIEKLSVRVDRESFEEVKVVAVDPVWDVALVKVDAKGLTPADYAESSDAEMGSWVIVNGATSRTKRRVLVGVISANRREIPPAGGAVLGVQLKEEKKSLEIKEVREGGGAESAGLKSGDIIKTIDGKKVATIKDVAEVLKGKSAGTKVKISVKRGEEEIEFEVALSARNELFQQQTRNDMMSGDFSMRRSGFPKVIQHDILANSHTMGGPVLNFDGRVIGMNIARANRAETFAIPVEELRVLAEKMIAQARN